MASEEDINNQRQMNSAREEERDYIKESYEFLGDTLDIGAKIADQLKSITNTVKDKTKLDKETLKRADETVKIISELGVDYTDLSKVQKDMEKVDRQRQKNLVTISSLSKNLTKDELEQARLYVEKEKALENQQSVLEGVISQRDELANKAQEYVDAGQAIPSQLQAELASSENVVKVQQKKTSNLRSEVDLLKQQTDPRAIQVALLEEQNKGLEEALAYLEEEERAIKNIQNAMGYWNVSLGAVKGIMEGIGLESAAVTLGLEAGQEAAEAMADRLTKGGQESLTFIGKFRVLAAGVAATTTTLFKEVGAALLAIFSVKAMAKLVGSFFKPLTKFVGDLKQKVVEAFNFIRNEFLSLDSFIADYQEGERLFFDISQAIADTATNLGLSTQAAQELYNQTEGIAKSVGMLPEEFLATAEALNQTFGTTKKFSDDTMKTLAQMTKLYGLSAEEASKLTMQAELQGQSASDYNLEAMETVMVLKERYNIALSEQEVIKATANASDSFKLSVGNSAKAIADAAFQAKRLGLEMSDLESMSNNLLDFENSISKEMEAELLLGKDLNLEKARQFALNNDIGGVAREVAKQIGSAAEFTKMNRIQQDALAESIGVSRDELANMLQTQELLAGTGFDDMSKAQEEFRNLVKETGSEEKALAKMREQGATEALTNRMREISAGEKRELQERAIAEAQMKIAEAALPMVNAFLDFLKYIKEIKVIIVQEMKPFFKAFSGLIKSAGKEMKDGMVSPAASLGKTLNNVGLTLVDLGKKYLPSIVRMFTSAYSVITSIFNIVGKIVAGLAQTKDSTEDTKNIFESISDFLLKVADYINNIDVDPILKFAEGVKNIFDKVLTVIGQITKFVKDNPKLVAGGALVIGGAVAAKKTVDNLLPLGSKLRPMTVTVENTDDFGEGGDDVESRTGGLMGKLKDKLGGLTDSLKDKLGGLTDSLKDKLGLTGLGDKLKGLMGDKTAGQVQAKSGKFYDKDSPQGKMIINMASNKTDDIKEKTSETLQDAGAGLKDKVMNRGNSDSGGGSKRGRGGIGGGLSSMGKGIGDFGKGVGKGIGGIFKGLASGLAAFANPAILLGATILSGSIVIIGAGIAGAAYIFSKVIPVLAEGIKSLEELDGPALMKAGLGLTAVGVGITALGVAGAMAPMALITLGAAALMTAAAFKGVEEFGKLNLDYKKIENNAKAVGAWALGMAALALGSAGGAVASLANLAGNLFDGIAGFFGQGDLPMDKIKKFGEANLPDAKKLEKNSKAVSAYASAMGSLAMASAGSAVASVANAIDNLFSGDGTNLPIDKIKKFGEANLPDAKKLEKNAKAATAYASGMVALAKGAASSAVASVANTIDDFFGGDGANVPIDKIKKFGEANLPDAKKLEKNAKATEAYASGMAALAEGAKGGAVASVSNWVGSLFGGDEIPVDKINKFGKLNLNIKGITQNAEAIVKFTESLSSIQSIDDTVEELSDSIDEDLIESFNLLNKIRVKELNLEGLVKEFPHLSKIANIVYANQDAFKSASRILTPSFIKAINLITEIVPPPTTDYTSLSSAAKAISKSALIILKTNNEYDIKSLPRVINSKLIKALNSLSTIIIPTQDFTLLNKAAQEFTQGLIVFVTADKEHNIRDIDDVLEDDVVESINLLQNIKTTGLDFSALPSASEKLSKALTIITATPAFLVIGDYLTRNLPTILNRVNEISFDKVNFEAMDQMSDKLPKLVEAYSKFGNLDIKKLQLATDTISNLTESLPKEGFVDQAIRGVEAIPRLLESVFKEGVDGVLEIASPKELDEVKSSLGLETSPGGENESLKQELKDIKELLGKVINRPIELGSTVTVELDGNKLGQALAQNNYKVQ